MNKTKLAAILTAAQKTKAPNDKKAFVAGCYECFFTDLFLIARALSRDLAEAEDKLQDFFTEKLLSTNCIDSFPTSETGMEAFIKVVFRNYLRSKWRKDRRYNELHQHIDDDGWKLLKEENSQLGYIDWETHLYELASCLNPAYQQILQLKMDKLSNEEIAKITGRTIDGVKSGYHRIKTKLIEMANTAKAKEMYYFYRA